MDVGARTLAGARQPFGPVRDEGGNFRCRRRLAVLEVERWIEPTDDVPQGVGADPGQRPLQDEQAVGKPRFRVCRMERRQGSRHVFRLAHIKGGKAARPRAESG